MANGTELDSTALGGSSDLLSYVSPACLCCFAHTISQSFKKAFLPFRPKENPTSPEKSSQMTPGHWASTGLGLSGNQVGPWSILPLIVFSNYFPFLLLFIVSYLWSSSQVRQQDRQRHRNILNSLWLLAQNLPHGSQIFEN